MWFRNKLSSLAEVSLYLNKPCNLALTWPPYGSESFLASISRIGRFNPYQIFALASNFPPQSAYLEFPKILTTVVYAFCCTGPCGSLVWVQVTHRHNNNNSFNKPTWNTYNINTLFTSSCSCLNTYVLSTLHVLQLRMYTVPESLWYTVIPRLTSDPANEFFG